MSRHKDSSGQSYKDWSNDCDEMDGGSDGGCIIPLIAILWIIAIILISIHNEEEVKIPSKTKTECTCIQNN